MITLYNTLTRSKQEFVPLKKTVTLYSCGPTVYHDVHIGNHRTFLLVDLIKRTLVASGFGVKHIMNITDVGHLTDDGDAGQDKLELGAAREHKTAWQVARFYEKEFKKDLAALNILRPKKFTRATEHIRAQIALIKKLERGGHTYKTSDGIYFDSTTFPAYGALAGLSGVQLQAGARVAQGEKKHETDFALWKFSPAQQQRHMEWKSPWGVGFPGWHIECSAMAMKYLGETIDIHTGAIDLIPVHHTNEIAQSEAATGKQFVRFWVHGAFVLDQEQKMSRSKGAIQTISWIVSHGFSALDYRYLTLQTHYRKELHFTLEGLEGARRARQQLAALVTTAPKRGRILRASYDQFVDALRDDLNVPRALGFLWELMNSDAAPADKRATILEMDKILGLNLVKEKKVKGEKLPPEIISLAAAREQARDEKNWAESDRLRAELLARGFAVQDTPQGQVVVRMV